MVQLLRLITLNLIEKMGLTSSITFSILKIDLKG